MLKRSPIDPQTTRLLGVDELMSYLSIGRGTAVKIGRESGALKKIGRRALYDRKIIDQYVDTLSE